MDKYFEPTLLGDVLESMLSQGETFLFEARSDNFSEERFITEF